MSPLIQEGKRILKKRVSEESRKIDESIDLLSKLYKEVDSAKREEFKERINKIID